MGIGKNNANKERFDNCISFFHVHQLYVYTTTFFCEIETGSGPDFFQSIDIELKIDN